MQTHTAVLSTQTLILFSIMSLLIGVFYCWHTVSVRTMCFLWTTILSTIGLSDCEYYCNLIKHNIYTTLQLTAGFYEFYNQRRRWTPSTMANILDLLLDFKNVTKRNNDISMLYVAYQMLLMVSSILTPGTIFLMILGAINMAYPQLSLYWALVLNLVPVGIFIVLCYVAKSDTQVRIRIIRI